MNQHVAGSQITPRLQGRGQPETYNGCTIQPERLAAIARELPPLLKMHHAELMADPDRAPLAPDWDRYFDAELVGNFALTTVRDGMLLVGYVGNFIGRHQHAAIKWCQVDLFFLHPGYRVGLLGNKLLDANERFMRERGVNKIAMAAKCHFDGRLGLLLKRMGYAPEDILYTKWIGG